MLRRRLFLSLLPLLVMLLAMGVYAVVLFSRMADNVDRAVSENYRSVVAAQEMTLALSQMDREIWAVASSGNLGAKALAIPQARFEENLTLQLRNNSLPGERAMNQQLASVYEEFQNGLVQLSRPGRPEAKHKRYDLEVVPRLLRMKMLLEQIRDLNQQAIVATGSRAKQITREGIRLMGIGMAVALLISGWTCYRFCRGLLRPIQLVTKASRELGEGNLNQPVPVISRDELGQLALAFNKMAAQLQEYRQSATEEIVQSHRTMETTLASFPDPIFVLDQNARIKLRNPAACVLTSSLQLDGELPAHLQAATRQALTNGTDFLPDNFKAVVSYRMNGAEKHFLPRIMALRSKENAMVGVALVLYDVTRFRLIDAAKTDLVATVSHELKTPLTSVRMVLHILLEGTVGPLAPEQAELLQAARNDTERLLVILNDLLDLARLEEGKSDLNWEEVAPSDLIQGVLARLGDKTTAAGLKVRTAINAELPAVSADPQRIGLVFTNLLTNAIKHSPPGGEIVVEAGLQENGWVRFSVTDQGPGIPEEFHARIFDRFFRVPGQTKTGAGLGLSIAREIVVAHGGRIGVCSKPGQGSSFYVILQPAMTVVSTPA